jgi:hypothetical protein
LEASVLFETQLFQDYVVNFPKNYFTLTIKRFNFEHAALKQELSTLYRREEFRTASGALHILQFLWDNNLGNVTGDY